MNDDNLIMWVVYDHPSDFPDYYVARKWIMEDPTGEIIMATTLQGVEDKLRDWGLTCMTRMDEDDPKILSVWL